MSEEFHELTDIERADLERRAREHVDGVFRELQAAADEVRTALRPSSIARRHPVALALLGAAAALALASLWRTRRVSRTVVAAPELQETERPSRAFRRSFASGIAGAAGRALPELLLLALLRGRRAGRKGTGD